MITYPVSLDGILPKRHYTNEKGEFVIVGIGRQDSRPRLNLNAYDPIQNLKGNISIHPDSVKTVIIKLTHPCFMNLSGSVINEEGDALPNARIHVMHKYKYGGTSISRPVQANGTFNLEEIDIDTLFRLDIKQDTYESYSIPDSLWTIGDVDVGDIVMIRKSSAEGTQSDINTNYTFEGKLEDEYGKPLQGYFISVNYTDQKTFDSIARKDMTNNEGCFTLRDIPISTIPWWVSISNKDRHFSYRNVSMTEPFHEIIPTDTHTLSGIVVDKEGTSLPNAYIALKENPGRYTVASHNPVTTDENGKFTFAYIGNDMVTLTISDSARTLGQRFENIDADSQNKVFILTEPYKKLQEYFKKEEQRKQKEKQKKQG